MRGVFVSDYKMFVWRHQPDFVVMVHAKSVAEARELALEECKGCGDESTPIRHTAVEFVRNLTPEIFYRECAEFVLTDSAELQEEETYARVLAERIKELTGKAGMSIEEFRATKNSLDSQ
jgi:hypothetical protein